MVLQCYQTELFPWKVLQTKQKALPWQVEILVVVEIEAVAWTMSQETFEFELVVLRETTFVLSDRTVDTVAVGAVFAPPISEQQSLEPVHAVPHLP